MRNFPEFVIAFWAIQLLGAVATLINAWAPRAPLVHCIVITTPKVIIVDPERADRLCEDGLLNEAREKAKEAFKTFVIRSTWTGGEGQDLNKKRWEDSGITSLEAALDNYAGPIDAWRSTLAPANLSVQSQSLSEARSGPPGPLPDDNATIFFTSGTTGLPKGVLSTQRSFLSNTFNSFVAKFRSMLRRGEDLPALGAQPADEPQKGFLASVPLFHAIGLTGLTVRHCRH